MKPHVLVLALCALVLGGLVALWTTPNPFGQPGGDSDRTSASGEALIGGPFSLVSHTGERVTEADLKGRYSLVYFGFTHCPDVCPAGLQVIGAALDQLGDEAAQVQPIFITVDPERDTPEQLASYVGLFHPRMIGLTGTEDEVRAAARAYRIYYAKVEDPSSSAEYTMDHSSITYLMDTEGRYLAHFNHGTDVDTLAEGVRRAIQ